MKLVITHRKPRLLRIACRHLARMTPEGFTARGVALRMRRPSKADAGIRRMAVVDARTFIESRSERHLHFSQHLNLTLNAFAASSAAVPRAPGVRDALPVLRAQRHWRQAREWLRPASAATAPVPKVGPARASLAARAFQETWVHHRQSPRTAPVPATPAARAPVSSGRDLIAASTRVSRTLARLRLAKREQEFQAEADQPQRAVRLRHRDGAVLRDRARLMADAREQALQVGFTASPRPVTLIYRKLAASPASPDRGMDLMQLARTGFRPAAESASPHPATHVPRNNPAAAFARIDDRALDGLADDIIRRIDKRSRVERERRGI